MPTIEEGRRNLQAGVESGRLAPLVPKSNDAPVPIPMPEYPASPNPALRTPMPPSLVLQPDTQRQFFNPATPQTRVPPTPPNSNPNIGAQAASQSITVVQSGQGTLLQTNGQNNAKQSVLNLIAGNGVTLAADAQGGVTVASSGGDGLTHGALPWEYDPAFTILRDDFHAALTSTSINGTFPSSAIGELGWNLFGTVSSSGGPSGVSAGVPPYVGQFSWSNTGIVNQDGWLTFAGSGGYSNVNHSQLSWALAENPGWKMTFVFKVETAGITSSRTFVTTKKSVYVGLTSVNSSSFISGPFSRPDQFIGVRFDTSATAPSINDSFFVLEVVANSTFATAARNNTQGTTKVTDVAPVAGAWHRLDIVCNSAGQVTLTLDGSSTNTLTATIPTFSITGTMTGVSSTSGGARINWTTSPTVARSVWNAGSKVTVSGFTAGRVGLNGTFEITGSIDADLTYNLASTIASGSDTVTLSGYPSWIPVFLFGNDDTAAPTANQMQFVVDYWALVWNPNLGPSAPGSPNATKPRYW